VLAMATSSEETAPLCPVTNLPAARRVQWVAARLLIDLWRITFGVDARSSFGGIERFGLWESPTGLYFFDPPLEGDHKFYSQFYARLKKWRLFTAETMRDEFFIAAKHIKSGDRVLDVGCGRGNFRKCVPESHYTGLDPHFAGDAAIDGVRDETLGQHLVENAGSYDAVCCFQVIEHVCDPKALFAEIVRAARPGGLICVGVPHVPSALTRIPNFLLNAPPHHLTWWSAAALRELAKSAGAVVETVETVSWAGGDSVVYWIERCSPIKCRDIYFRGAFAWHAAALVGSALGLMAAKMYRPPKPGVDEGAGLLLIARKPTTE
jgi:2-polyprenyl-3-methyl-5-hydroxy-6-metoxy-1,4-benzoquinol methylase